MAATRYFHFRRHFYFSAAPPADYLMPAPILRSSAEPTPRHYAAMPRDGCCLSPPMYHADADDAAHARVARRRVLISSLDFLSSLLFAVPRARAADCCALSSAGDERYFRRLALPRLFTMPTGYVFRHYAQVAPYGHFRYAAIDADAAAASFSPFLRY